MKNIIIDTDPGIDDAFALIYAFNNPGFYILGITTVSGNGDIKKVTENALKLVKYCDKDIGVYLGENKPYARELPKDDSCHGDDGLGGAGKGLSFDRPSKENAVDFIIDMATRYKDISLVTLGPLTNIARAIEKDPVAMKNIKEIISMGGGIDIGNVTDYAEFNYWADPEAAKIVFDFSIPITMVGLNATNQSFFTKEDFDIIKSLDTREGRLLYKMQKPYTEHYKKTYGIDGCRIHDLLAMIVASDKNIVEGKKGEVDIRLDDKYRGQTLVDYRDGGGVWLVDKVDQASYKKEFMTKVFNMTE